MKNLGKASKHLKYSHIDGKLGQQTSDSAGFVECKFLISSPINLVITRPMQLNSISPHCKYYPDADYRSVSIKYHDLR